MGDGTGIEWTDATWNPTVGCTSVSPGCDNCYARQQVDTRFHPAAVALATKVGRAAHPDDDVAAAATAAGNLALSAFPTPFDVVSLRPGTDLLTKPLRWGRPRKVFVNSLSDLFHADVPDDFIAQVFAVMALAPQHTFQLLTKRHGRMRSLLPQPAFLILVGRAYRRLLPEASREVRDRAAARERAWLPDIVWPLPNVWLGVSVETQREADLRIPALLDTPAAVRWLSCEPLLGPVDVERWLPTDEDPSTWPGGPTATVRWVVVGGESGRGARPMHPDWARSLRDQCAAADVPFLFKQWGEWAPGSSAEHGQPVDAAGHPYVPSDVDGPNTLPRGATWMARVGKKAAGRELGGVLHDGYPAVADA